MERKKKYYRRITQRLLFAFFFLSIVPIVSFAWIMNNSLLYHLSGSKLYVMAIYTAPIKTV